MLPDDLTGRRILVVEDDILIAMLIEEILEDLGCVIVGPVATLNEALRLAGDAALDAAVLDVTIRGGLIYPAAEQLLTRGIPFILASGYGDWALPEAFRNMPRLTKPFTPRDIETQIRLLFRATV